MEEKSFFTDLIIDHYKNPRNFGKLMGTSLSATYANPYCGDEITVYGVVKDNVIKEISFEGAGCSLCIASMSLLSEQIIGKSVIDVENLASEKVLSLTGTPPGSKRESCSLIGFYAVKRLFNSQNDIIA